MARSAILGNGRLAVGLDEKGFVNDFYYPHVGLHNMTSARNVHHKIGIWVDSEFSWLNASDWEHHSELVDTAMMGRSYFHNARLGVSISIRDFVDYNLDLFGRVVIVENRTNDEKNIRIFFGQVFEISRQGRADTALYTPGSHPYILTYHGNISIISSLRLQGGESFDQFAVGNYEIEGKEGTHKDAEDGELTGNLVEHGGVDSVIRASFSIHPKGSLHLDYWNCASSKGYNHASDIHRAVSKNGLYHYLNATNIYWKEWLGRSSGFISSLDQKYQPLARKSLLTIRAHCDNGGGILASADSSIYNYGRDYYSYVWPRDAYYSLMPLLRLGYTEEVKRYLDFNVQVMHRRGYVHHKYQPDKSMGSTWHPLVQDGMAELNIQEDETASCVLLALEYIKRDGINHRDALKYIDKIIVPGCDFMSGYIDDHTGLPHPSYDLWEQLFLTSTYTTSIVYAALQKSLLVVRDYDRNLETSHWESALRSIEKNIGKLYSMKNQWFMRGIAGKARDYAQNETLDISSLYGTVSYGPPSIEDTTVFTTAIAVEEHLINKGATGGVIRYPGDDYMLTDNNYPGNPWYVCTLWLGQYYLAVGKQDKAIEMLDWTINHVTRSGMLSEQIDPAQNHIRGVAPLVWSHAEYLSLLQKLFA